MSGEAVNFSNKKALVAGLGISGQAAFDALVSCGTIPALYDSRDIASEAPGLFAKFKTVNAETYFGGEQVPDIDWDCIILSPGIPPDLPFLLAAKEKGAEFIGELELSYLLGHGKYAAITGTNGKTTTTTLVYEIFRNAGLDAVVAGNIGRAVVTEALAATDDTWLITEVSSFQLETVNMFCPRISAFLNLTPDHMDRHKTMENYGAAKARIFKNQSGSEYFVYNADDEIVVDLARQSRAKNVPFSRTKILPFGMFVKDSMMIYADDTGAQNEVISVDEIMIPGAHNLENALAAVAVAICAGIDFDVIAETLRCFKGVEHRLEHIITVGGVRFVNDSKGTNPDAAIKALEAVEKDIILIAGGYDKDADFTSFVNAAKGRVKHLLVMGATAGKVRAAAEQAGIERIEAVSNMKEAISCGFATAEPGDTVLLSPACASWDMYKNFEERGDDFRHCSEALAEEVR